MTAFFLFRIKIERGEQPNLFDSQTSSPAQIIEEALKENPFNEVRKNNFWRIGNYSKLEDNAVFFALGKTTKRTVEIFDENARAFRNENSPEAPYTYVLIDLEKQICAIAHKPKLSPNVINIAGNLARLLSETNVAKTRNLSFSIPAIRDPVTFINIIRNAHSIESFTMSFSKPNPWDVNKDFHKPMENFLQATNASAGKTTIKGNGLISKPLEDLAHSAASTGNEVTAKIKHNEKSKLKTVKMDGTQSSVTVDDVQDNYNKIDLLRKVRELYNMIRGVRQ